ncbi:hypothetical protein EQI52_06020 [Leuconostoc mesenteroides]|uniref:beta strand repeat-containing protein n=1 Tax=Leuconostoc mesenteroides TaxID=1245 RepID=UPI000FFCDCC9|nr:hypothetical protein [Leuconostoc mesenteroides]QAR69367.1 hypothetical protein EQI52_06020 [Leuconostoc mesenteroides]WJM73906.1 hypothetical protein QTN54_03830 [Leuconostoc mesenteroides]
MAYQPTDWEHGDIITGGKLNKIEKELTHVADNATYGFGGAQLSSDGLTPFSYINAGDPMPANPQKGDTVFLKDSNDFLIYSYNGEDWVLKIDPDLSNRIEETIKTASDNTDKAIADNNTQINETINQVAKEQADLAIKDGDFNNKAQAMADKALSDAKANTAQVAQDTLNSANKNLNDAKTSLTSDLQKEISDRTDAVAALDTKAKGYADDAKKSATDGIAQEAKDRATAVSAVDNKAKGYADQAKQDAVDTATSADGVINKKIDDTASSLTSTISQNKIDANGKISTAQSTATQALNGLSTKVENTDYDKKTGDLTTQLNATTTTANQSKQDIVDIKNTNSSQDSKINGIVSDATKTQQTISDIQKSQSTQSDKLNQITTDVNGTKQEITDIQTKDGQQDTRMGTIETSVSGVKSDFSTYKTDANGRISTAQTTAQTAVDGLKTKVNQTDYNIKTGQLTTDVNSVTQTANQSKQDIVSINQKDGQQDSRMNTIETDANGTKQTVSNIQTVQGQQSGSISTLQQRADGFDATVTKVNNLAVGGRNYWSFTNKIDGQLIYPDGSITNSASGLTAYNPNYFDIKQGQTVWVTIYNTISTNNATLAGRLVYYDKDKNFISSTSDIAITQGNYKNIAPSNSAYFRISLFKYTNIKIKVEVGTLYTDWTPAPEDVDSATAKAQLTADQANTSLNAYKTDADGRITKAQSDIIQTAKDVTTKVSQTDYNAKTGQLSTDVSNAQQTANSAVTTIGSYKTSNDNRVAAAETKISQNANAITLRATKSDLDTAKSDYTAKVAQVQLNVDSVTTSVSNINTKVNNLSVGGRNYWSLTNKIDTKYIEQDGTIKTSGSGLTAYNPNYFAVTSGSTIIVSILDTDFSAPTTLAGRIVYYDANKNFVSVSANIPITKGVYPKIIPTGVFYFRISLFKYTDIRTKVEIGNIPTDWTPAPEDTDNKFSAQQVTIDGITNTVSSQGSSINSLTTRVQTAEGTLSTATNNITGLQSKQTQTANQITQEISDRTNGDSNTLQSSKDFTTSSVSSAVNGVNSTITQTSDSLIAKINTKTDSDTVLSILKDNWSIGITDNISKITSGIVGNASQMSIISKNVTIDSPNTQIKGTAWIQSAMIANGAIGSAQIGDATITSAKIATLDVAKLTGNVSNFIQSNWNGLYQSVKISPIGMTISTSQGSTAQFNQDGLVLDGALGTTNVLNGQIELISSSNEYLGTFQHETMPEHDNVDYLMIKLAGWHTSKPEDSDYDLNSDSSNTIRGGDGIGFGVTNSVGTYDMKMSWDSSLVAGYKGRKAGWHVEDIMTWHQPTYFEGGFDVAQQFSSTDRRALHIQGATLSNGHKWFGFFDTPSQAGFGTDDTNDVLFYVKGKSYSLYTMLNKLSML